MSGKNGALTAEEIFKLEDRPIERVDFPERIPGWGGHHVFIRSIGGDERDGYELSFSDDEGKLKKDKRGIRSKLVALCACNEEGVRLFTDVQAKALGSRNAAALDLMYTAARRLNGISEEDIQELAGNSSGGRSAASGSRSQHAKAGQSPKPSRE